MNTRIPYPEEVTVADVLAFEAWPDDQKQIARAAVAFEAKLAEAYDEGYIEGHSEGVDAGIKRGEVLGLASVRAQVTAAYERLRLLLPMFGKDDSRGAPLREVSAMLAEVLDAQANAS